MKKGENIFKRKDGRWEARYIKGYELSGKIKYGFCYGKTYKEAKEKVTKYKAALLVGKPTPQTGTRHRFAFYCDEWLRLQKAKYENPPTSSMTRFWKSISSRSRAAAFRWELLRELWMTLPVNCCLRTCLPSKPHMTFWLCSTAY